MLRALGVGAGMWIPVTSFGRTHGVMSLGLSGTGRTFGDAEVAVAEKLGHRAAQAIERARAEERLRVRARQQAAVAGLGRLALAGVDLDHLLQRGVELVSATLGVELVKVLQLLPGSDRLRMAAGTGFREGLIGQAEVGADEESQAGYTLVSGGPVIVEDLRTESRFSGPDLALDHGAISGISVVIGSRGDQPYGVLSTHTRDRRDFSVDDVSFLEAVANVLGTAIDRTQADLALRESDERLHVALAASRTGTWEWDVARGGLSWSSEIGVLHGMTADDYPRNLDEYLALVHPEDRAFVQAAIARSFETGEYDLEFRVVWPDGDRPLDKRAGNRLLRREQRPVRMVGTGRDVTDRKLAELERDRLLEQERHATLMREAFLGVMSTRAAHADHDDPGRQPSACRPPRHAAARDRDRTPRRHRRRVGAAVPSRRGPARAHTIGARRPRPPRRADPARPDPRAPRPGAGSARRRADRRQRHGPAPDGRRRRHLCRADPAQPRRQRGQVLTAGLARGHRCGGDRRRGGRARARPRPGRLEGGGRAHLRRLLPLAADANEDRGSGIGLFVTKRLVEAMNGRIWARPRDGGGAEFGFALRRPSCRRTTWSGRLGSHGDDIRRRGERRSGRMSRWPGGPGVAVFFSFDVDGEAWLLGAR